MFRLAFVFFDPTANKATLAHPPHHGQVIWDPGGRQPVRQFRPIFNVAVFSPSINERYGASPLSLDMAPGCYRNFPRWSNRCNLHLPLISSHLLPDQRFVAVVRTQSHFIVAVSSRWTQRSAWLFFLANSNRSVAHIPMSTPSSTRLAMLGHGATPPLPAHLTGKKRWSDHILAGLPSVRFGNFTTQVFTSLVFTPSPAG